jgi:hypothetical protein
MFSLLSNFWFDVMETLKSHELKKKTGRRRKIEKREYSLQ